MALHNVQPQSRRCVTCGYINSVRELVCQRCRRMLNDADWLDAPLKSAQKRRKTIVGAFASEVAAASDKRRKSQEMRSAKAQNPDTRKTQKLQRDPAHTTNREGTSVFDSTMVLYIKIDADHPPLILRLPQNRALIIGRDDPEADHRPDIDLIPYGGYSKGISRLHAALELSGKRLTLRDLESSNGTYLNDSRLDPHEAHQLRDGDAVRLGDMAIKINFKQ